VRAGPSGSAPLRSGAPALCRGRGRGAGVQSGLKGAGSTARAPPRAGRLRFPALERGLLQSRAPPGAGRLRFPALARGLVQPGGVARAGGAGKAIHPPRRLPGVWGCPRWGAGKAIHSGVHGRPRWGAGNVAPARRPAVRVHDFPRWGAGKVALLVRATRPGALTRLGKPPVSPSRPERHALAVQPGGISRAGARARPSTRAAGSQADGISRAGARAMLHRRAGPRRGCMISRAGARERLRPRRGWLRFPRWGAG
jgi:hypothetical protein